jgi:hypothetical protein
MQQRSAGDITIMEEWRAYIEFIRQFTSAWCIHEVTCGIHIISWCMLWLAIYLLRLSLSRCPVAHVYVTTNRRDLCTKKIFLKCSV